MFQHEAEVISGPQGSRGPLNLCLGFPYRCGPKAYDLESSRDVLTKTYVLYDTPNSFY